MKNVFSIVVVIVTTLNNSGDLLKPDDSVQVDIVSQIRLGMMRQKLEQLLKEPPSKSLNAGKFGFVWYYYRHADLWVGCDEDEVSSVYRGRQCLLKK